jgi:hypothetical protein
MEIAIILIGAHLIVPILGILLVANIQASKNLREERRKLFTLYLKCRRR